LPRRQRQKPSSALLAVGYVSRMHAVLHTFLLAGNANQSAKE